MEKVFNLKLDLNGRSANPRIVVRRNDFDTNVFAAQIFQNGVPVDITGYTVMFECVTPSRNSVRDTGTIIDAAQGRVKYTLTDQLFSSLGEVDIAYFGFEKQNGDRTERFTTGNFAFEVQADAMTGNVPAGDYLSDIAQMIEQINQLKIEYETLNPANYPTRTEWTENNNQVTTQLAEEVQKRADADTALAQQKADKITINTDNKLLKGSLYSSVDKISEDDFTRGVTYFQAVIKNPISMPYNNVPIQLKIKFNKGECPNPNFITVKDKENNSLIFQWEGEKHPNPSKSLNTNLATYSDGSLKAGTIWILGSLAVGETSIYTIELHTVEQNNNFSDRIIKSVDESDIENPRDTFACGNTSIQFDSPSNNYVMRGVTVSGTKLTDDFAHVIAPFIKNTDLTDIETMGSDASLWTSETVDITGEGYIFKDYVVKTLLTAMPSIYIITKHRIFYNGMVMIDCRLISEQGTTDRTIQGFGVKAGLFNDGLSVGHTDLGNINTVIGSQSLGIQVINASLTNDIVDSSIMYNAKIEDSTSGGYKRLSVNWSSDSDKHLIAGSTFYIKLVICPGINDVALFDTLQNMLSVHATKSNKNQLKKRYIALCKKFVDHMHDYPFSDDFRGLVYLENLAYNKVNSIITEFENSESINDFIDMINTRYSGGTAIDFQNSWLGGRGVEFIGRDMAAIKYFMIESKRVNKLDSYNTLVTTVHNLADFYVWLETYSGGNGQIKLNVTTEDNCNAEATAMKALHESLLIEANSDRESCFNRIKNRLENTLLFNNILPYRQGESVITHAQIHYHYFTLFDYLETVDFNCPFDIASYINQCVEADGKIFELGFNHHPSRFGFAHTYLYAAYALYHYGTLSSLQTACHLVENILSECFPSGYHEYPIDGWVKQADSIDMPIEVQAAYKPLIEIIYNEQ